uniref:Putative 6-Pyruvoyl tetrahydrobiopterin synthase n=1 Tax=viral metagenome TaxID=1070528 RepID=A0A6H1ZVJ2_9ZZZZ
MISITKEFRFEAAHHLPNYEGKCRFVHGHSYLLAVEVSGEIDESSETALNGMVMDFGELKKVVNKKIIDKLDHTDLNNIFKSPTAEVMTYWIVRQLRESLPFGVRLNRVRLWETDTSYAEWKAV